MALLKKSTFTKNLVIIVFVIIVSWVVYFGWYFQKSLIITQIPPSTQISPTPSYTQSLLPIKNWLTYTSSEGKITFQYPPNSVLHINEEHVFETNSFQPKPQLIELDVDSSFVHAIPSIELEYFTQNPSEIITQRIKTIQNCMKTGTTQNGIPITVGTQVGTFFQTSCGAEGYDVIFLIKNGLGYAISVNGDYNKKFFGTFLSTISFF